jgi:ATP-grasp domain-containing protein/L-aminoacid ligase-like protein
VVLLRRTDGDVLKRVLLLATTTGYQIRSFGEAAERVGIRLVFASDRCDRLEDPWWDQAIPVRFHDDRWSVDAVTTALAGLPPDGIVAVGDRPVVLAARLAQVFGLAGHPPDAAAISRNKLLVRRALAAAGLPVPWFECASPAEDVEELAARARYPAVVKPLALSGSRGVMRVDDPDACVAAVDRLRQLLASPDVQIERDAAHGELLLESFIPGTEYAVEGLLDHGTFRCLAVFDKPDPLDGPFFEETIYVTPSRSPQAVERQIVAAMTDAARAIGLHHGPVHGECRVNACGTYVLEMAARPIGGLCSRALRFGAPGSLMSLEELLLRHAVGEDVCGVAREENAAGVMMIPIPKRGIYRGVSGVDAARAVSGVEDVRITAKQDVRLVPLPEGKSYLGFIFARGAEPRVVEDALREAHSRLQFVIDREMPLAD